MQQSLSGNSTRQAVAPKSVSLNLTLWKKQNAGIWKACGDPGEVFGMFSMANTLFVGA